MNLETIPVKNFLANWSVQLPFKLKHCFVVLCWTDKYHTLPACKHPNAIPTHRDFVTCRLGAISIHHRKGTTCKYDIQPAT